MILVDFVCLDSWNDGVVGVCVAEGAGLNELDPELAELPADVEVVAEVEEVEVEVEPVVVVDGGGSGVCTVR